MGGECKGCKVFLLGGGWRDCVILICELFVFSLEL